MAKIKLKMVDGIGRKRLADAFSAFMRHCQLKNLAPYSIRYKHIYIYRYFLSLM